jgi:hypothetical protein
MKFKYMIVVIAFVSCTSFAQEVLTSITWNVGIPVSKLNEYTTGVSYRGFTLQARRFYGKENSLGISLGWNIFDEKSTEPINLDYGKASGTISGTQVRTVNSFPILVGFDRFFGKRNDTGVYYILQRLNIGVYQIDNDNWHFGIAPEGGFVMPIEGETGLLVGVRYNYAFDSGTALGGAENNFYSYWEINLGLSFSSQWF